MLYADNFITVHTHFLFLKPILKYICPSYEKRQRNVNQKHLFDRIETKQRLKQ